MPALEAAHIWPYGDGGSHEAANGLLLRRDIHSLFDAGYVTVTPDHHFGVSRRIREEFENGKDYYALHGNRIRMPDNPSKPPDPAKLAGKPAPKKHAVFTLVERDGEARSFHVTNVNAKTLRPILVSHASRKSALMTDEAIFYESIGREYALHRRIRIEVGSGLVPQIRP